MLVSNSAAAPRSMSENGGGIRPALFRNVATWFCSAAVACAVSNGFSSSSTDGGIRLVLLFGVQPSEG